MNKKIIGISGILFVLLAAGTAMAFQGNPMNSETPVEERPNYNPELHEQMETAIENQDYDAWIQLREDNNMPMRGKIFSVINEDNFYLFSELHEARESGDLDRMQEIRDELGLGQGTQSKGRQGMNSDFQGKGSGMKGNFS